MRDRSGDYEAAGPVIGVSPDPVEEVKKFAASSTSASPCWPTPTTPSPSYGTWVEKSMYGKKYMGVQRATFLIDPEGEIAKVFPKVSPKTHDDVVLGARRARRHLSRRSGADDDDDDVGGVEANQAITGAAETPRRCSIS